MPVSDTPFTIYRDNLSALAQGLALWDPKPRKNLYDNVSIGDVGYMHDGMFLRMFNVTLPCDHPSNLKLGRPEYEDPLNCGPFTNTIEANFDKVDHCSRHVTSEANTNNLGAMTPDDSDGVTYKFRNRGALLSLPEGGCRHDVIRTKMFEDYIRDHVDKWFSWAQSNGLGVERMEDLILVSGCTLVTSWAAATCVDNTYDAEASLTSRPIKNNLGAYLGVNFIWNNVRGHVPHHNSGLDPLNPQIQDQCVFIRGFRAKRILFWTRRMRAQAEPRPDDPDDHREDEIHVSEVPGTMKNRDPLVGVLDYIEEKCQMDNVDEGILAIAHHDDLQYIENVETMTMTADAIQEYLHEKQLPLLVENGAAILQDATDNEPQISDDKKATFYATADLNGEPVPLVIHPVLTKYNIKLEVKESSDPDYALPTEDMNSPAVHPPMLSLKLESHQGYPQIITVEASSGTEGVGVTVQDVLQTLQEDLKVAFPRRELSKLGHEQRAMINGAFRERCKSEEELSKGPRRIDHLGGRDRLQILPKYGSDGSLLIPPSIPETLRAGEALDESMIAGSSSNPIR